MLALRDRNHVVEASIPGLADVARVTVEECRDAIQRFLSPDVDSRSPEHEGRRIEKTDCGWRILNGEKYRNKMNEDERREYNRIKQRETRARKKGGGPTMAERLSEKLFNEGAIDQYGQPIQTVSGPVKTPYSPPPSGRSAASQSEDPPS